MKEHDTREILEGYVKRFKRKAKNKTIAFLGGPVDSVPFIARAWALGYDVIIVDMNPECAGFQWVGEMHNKGLPGVGWRMANVYDAEEVLDALGMDDLDGILAVAVDVGPVVSSVARWKGLPHIPEEISLLGWNKLSLKQALQDHIAMPKTIDYVVTKPIYQGRGSRGVKIFYPLREATEFMEEYLEGDQISGEAIIENGQIVFCGFTDRNYEGRSPVERGGWGPTKYYFCDEYQLLVFSVRKIIDALGIVTGTAKFDFVLHRGLPFLIEMAIGRIGGGRNGDLFLALSYNVDFVLMACQVATGESVTKRQLNKKPYYVFSQYERLGKHNADRGKVRFRLGQTRLTSEEKMR